MLSAALALATRQTPDLRALDALAQKRDVAGLTAYLTPESVKPYNPLAVLKTNGAYETGKFGWHALELQPPTGTASYVVLSTPITSEDVGEMVFERAGDKLRYVPEDNDLGVRILSHAFEIGFDVPTKRVSITDTMSVTKTRQGRGHYFIRMSPYLKVESVDGGRTAFTQASGITALPSFPGKSVTLVIKYSGIVDQPQYAGSIASDEIQLSNDYWYPMIARYPAPYTVHAAVPPGWTLIGQGEPSGPNGFKMDLPVVYYSLSAGPYKSASQQDDQKRITAWSMILDADQLRLQTELDKPILRFYSQTFTPLPFSGFGALATRLYGGGALEAYSYATYGRGFLPWEDAHEPAHTWWGGIINNTYLHSLWNESFAVFCEGLYGRNVPIGNHDERRLAFIQDARPQQDYLVAPPASASPWVGPASSSIGYGKGAWVLQMLETQLGTETMVKTMRQWLADQPKGQPGEWEDYEKAVAKVTKQDLKWFFDQWIRKTGWARFEVKKVKWADGKLNGTVQFTGDPYRIECEAMLQFPDGKRTFTKFNTMERKEGAGYAFTISAPEKPSLVSIDPWRRVLREQKPDESPTMLRTALEGMRRYSDPAHADYLPKLGGEPLTVLPKDLAGTFLVGSPETLKAMAPLCAKAGFTVKGSKLTYKGTTIDLGVGGAIAVVDLPEGKHCAIGLGTFKHTPDYGRARLVVFDQYGRFLRGETEPKTKGWMTFNLLARGKDDISGKTDH